MDEHLEKLRADARAAWKRLDLPACAEMLDPKLPQVERVYSFGRGVPTCVWILGRVVRAMAGGVKVDDMSFEDFLAKGWPPEAARAIGEDVVARVRSAVERLAPLACMCGTGAQTVDEHGSIRVLASGQNPDSPVDDHTEIGFCTRCRRGWEFNACGDSHYSYGYEVRPIDLAI